MQTQMQIQLFVLDFMQKFHTYRVTVKLTNLNILILNSKSTSFPFYVNEERGCIHVIITGWKSH